MPVSSSGAYMYCNTGAAKIDLTLPAEKKDRFPAYTAFHEILALGCILGCHQVKLKKNTDNLWNFFFHICRLKVSTIKTITFFICKI